MNGLERKLFSRRDFLPLALLLLGAGILFLLLSLSPAASVAIVEQEGRAVHREDLSMLQEEKELTFQGRENRRVTIRFTRDGAQVVDAQCPDKTCMQTGKITRAGETALCLPARISVRLEGRSQTDGETY